MALATIYAYSSPLAHFPATSATAALMLSSLRPLVMRWHIGDVVRKLREAAQLSTRELAMITRLSPKVINRIEKGRTTDPRATTLDRIALPFGLTGLDLRQAVPREPFPFELAPHQARTMRSSSSAPSVAAHPPRVVATIHDRRKKRRRA